MYKYDFGLSFAKPQREEAEQLARLLNAENVNVFYDYFEQADLWGKDLYQKFHDIYGKECRFFIPFVSAGYIENSWPKHELKQAQARAFKSNAEYILPLRFDDTEVPGLNITTGYIDFRTTPVERITELCLSKLVADSAVRKLFLFLRVHNPEAMEVLKSYPPRISIRVAHQAVLNQILAEIDPRICEWQDHKSIILNGGVSQGCIRSIDPEPHNIFSLTLHEPFYHEIKI